MKKKNLILIALMCSLGLSVVGCSNQEMVILTENEQQVVAEYAASILMQYNAGSNMRVLTGKELALAEAEDQARREQEAKRQQAVLDYQSTGGTVKTTTTVGGGEVVTATAATGTGTVAENTVAAIEDLGNFLAVDGFSIIYQNYEVVDSYADSHEENLMMAMDATAGKKLLVAHFAVTNNNSEEALLDVLSLGGKFRLTADGETFQSQYTLLLSDLSMYKGIIEAGATADTVLVFELPEERSAPGSLELIVSLGNQKGTITLQ